MTGDRAAFAFGILALALAGLGLWTSYGHVDWRLVGVIAPAGMVVIGVGMLLLSRNHT